LSIPSHRLPAIVELTQSSAEAVIPAAHCNSHQPTTKVRTGDDIDVTSTVTQKLFTPIQVGPLSLSHRVVMAPLTRSRAQQPGDIPSDLMVEYYGQRASSGGLIISEATTISISGRGWFGAPGMYSNEQVEGWRRVLSAVHAKGGHMFSQLWHTGRASHRETTNGSAPVSPSGIPFEGLVSTPDGWLQPSPPRALDITEIPAIIEDYRKAAERAKAAGFEGVELHGANGYLPDQFLQDGTNKRTDATADPSRTVAGLCSKYCKRCYRCGAGTG